ncbi:hypothetical protein [Hahella sp. CCB-MM4]|uniref:hypothetical protein n=1 Tax=Hahella sp. (strain CCB-MM4) TaxID=1926491 RepID=UPI0011406F7E|nr:hypothetical protein [Hahella sp. CCB-MM4]
MELAHCKLTKGVDIHPFSDGSGCVFFNTNTGETIGIELRLEQIEEALTVYFSQNTSEKFHNPLKGLIEKGFISTENQQPC